MRGPIALPRAELTASGRPALRDGEVERALLDKVDIEFPDGGGGGGGGRVDGEPGPPAQRYQGGYAVATSHRVLWIDAGAAPRAGRSAALWLACLGGARKRVQYGLNLVNPKVRLELTVHVDASGRPCAAHESSHTVAVALRCRGPAPDAFLEQLSRALQADQQQRAAAAALSQQQPLPPPSAGASQVRPMDADGWGAGAGDWGGGASMAGPGGQQAAANNNSGQQALRASAADVDASYLRAVVEMGFPRNRAVRALAATRNEGVQAALDWLLAYGDDPLLDAPLEGEGEGGVGAEASGGFAAAAAAAAAGVQQQQQQYYPTLPGGGGGDGGGSSGNSFGGGGSASGSTPLTEARRAWQAAQVARGSAAATPSYASGGAGASFANPLLAPAGPLGAPLGGGGPSGSVASVGVGSTGGGGGGGASVNTAAPLSASAAGVAGIMAREQGKTALTGQALSTAFADLSALMAAAQEMVELAERFRQQQVAAAAGGGGGGSVATEAGGLDADTAAALVAAGVVVSPVTRAVAGAQYLEQLSRQLADFLEAPLRRAAGLLLLPDVYCLFNRARGTELVSPDDLVAACELFERLDLPPRLKRYASGVIVVAGPEHSDAATVARIAALLREGVDGGGVDGGGASGASGGIDGSEQQQQQQQLAAHGPVLSATAVGIALGLPVTLAREALLVAEAAGAVCRDDGGPEGLRFFRNFFADAAADRAADALLSSCSA